MPEDYEYEERTYEEDNADLMQMFGKKIASIKEEEE